MKRYVVRRVSYVVPLLVALSVFSFALGKVAPGDPARALLQQRLDHPPSEEQVEEFRKRLGLDDPAIVQYGRWVTSAMRGDLGTSFRTGESVSASLLSSLPVTAKLSLLGFVIAVGAGVPLGVLAALRRQRLWDHISRVFALGAASMPSFWFGYLLIIAFAVQLNIFPTQGTERQNSYILPAITLSVYALGVLVRLTRASMLDVLGDDFVLAARARGLPRRSVVIRHTLRVALNPVLTYSGLLVGGLLGGAVIVETVFAMPGMGKLVVDAITDRDFPVVQGFVLYFGTLVLLTNLMVDLLYVVVDPRVRLFDTNEGIADGAV